MCLSKLVHFSKAILLLLLSGILLPAPLLAHGGVGVQHLNNVPAGPFRVYVWSDPEPPQVGEYHVTVALTENMEGDSTGLAGGPVLDAVVTVELTHEESGETLSARATHDDALNKLFYEASFEPARQGNWSVRVSILPPGCATAQGSSEQQGGDSGLSCESEQVVSFQDEILPKAFPWRALLGGILSILLIMGAVVLYWATKPPTAIEEPAPAKQQEPAPAGGHS
ncbi:MAG: hypothetical protein F4047_04855 [Caldilineaceae bacterium SB0670_bin_27]|uniref:Uncharacterized protein n=1 Tax=Caldilineaceae bacterium SB0664_bin_27 TaxID=2605260 RepID=A0A6B0YLE3_9CHLR|nr:hypothetical protein [Caldilineaceae bacterium SB0664_bin_27]MYJ77482.1 hypothetical protein [Caldilineaceae bacterium SB0670_bin_27]